MKTLAATVMLLMMAIGATAQPVMDYVKAPDPSFRWSVTEVTEQLGTKLAKLEMVSQTWQGGEWDHALWILMPDNVEDAKLATVFITGGEPDMTYVMLGSQLVKESNSIIAVLGGIPKQPLYDGLKEDALIAYTFVQYLGTGDESWPLLFPMTKAVVRAMDAVEQYLDREHHHKLKGFVTTGASKRGWTTWFTGAVDDRVIGMIPIVYDNLNMPAQMKQQREVYGVYSEQIDDYTKYNLQDRLQSPEGALLGSIVDPYTYRQCVTEPVLILAGANDPYWTLESAQLYFDDIPGATSILYAPNGGHDMGGIDVILGRLKPAMVAFLHRVGSGEPWPALDWACHSTAGRASVTLKSDIEPSGWGVWVATADTMDFRPSTWHYYGFNADGTPTKPSADAPELRFRGAAMTKGGEWVRTVTVQEADAPYMALIGEMQWQLSGQTLTLTTVADIVKQP